MKSFKELWPSQTDIIECIPYQAERLSPGTLRAVHEPMQLLFQLHQSTVQPTAKSDFDFLRELKRNTNGPLPVLGEVGSGKSHLVRWVDSQLRSDDDAARFHIVRIPKNASLRSVIESMLEGIDGPEFEEMRKKARAIGENKTAREMAQQLLLHMGQELVRRTNREMARIQSLAEASGGHLPEYEQETFELFELHGGQDGLIRLINDQAFQDHLLAPDSPVMKFASRLAGGDTGGGIDDDELLNFSDAFKEGDLSFRSVEMSHLSEPAKIYLAESRINNDEHALREVASLMTDLLNTSLQSFFDDSFQYAGGSFQDLFRDIRKYLKSLSLELFVLVEDMAAISAIADKLIDCLIEDPNSELCDVHSVIASTPEQHNFNKKKSTVSDRAGGIYFVDIDQRTFNEKVLLDRVVDMCGRYLNAARHGRAVLDQALDNQLPVPEITIQQCDLDWDATSSGYPLFPLTRTSVERLAKTYLLNESGSLVFSPRKVLNRIVLKVLQCEPPWRSKRFPPTEEFPEIPYSTDVVLEFRKLQYENPDSAALFVSIWGNGATDIADARVELSDEVCRCLGFETLLNIDPSQNPKPKLDMTEQKHPEPSSPSGAQTIPRWQQRADADLEKVDAWAQSGTTLDQTISKDVRDFVAQSFNARVPSRGAFGNGALDVVIKSIQIPNSLGDPSSNFIPVSYAKSGSKIPRDLHEFVRCVVRYTRYVAQGSYEKQIDDIQVIQNYLDTWFLKAFADRKKQIEEKALDAVRASIKEMIYRGDIRTTDSGAQGVETVAGLLSVDSQENQSIRLFEHLSIKRRPLSDVQKERSGSKALVSDGVVFNTKLIKKALLMEAKEFDKAWAVLAKRASEEIARYHEISEFVSGFKNYDQFSLELDSATELLAHTQKKRLMKDFSDQSPTKALSSLENIKTETVYANLEALNKAMDCVSSPDKGFNYLHFANKVDLTSVELVNDFLEQWNIIVHYLESISGANDDDAFEEISEQVLSKSEEIISAFSEFQMVFENNAS